MAAYISTYKSRYFLSVAVIASLSAGSAFAQDTAAGATAPSVPAPAVTSSQPSVAPTGSGAAPVVPVAQPAAPAAPTATPPVTVAATTPEAPETVSCLLPPAKLTDEKVSEFTDDPSALLQGTESGGMVLSSRVNGLVGSSSTTLDKVVALSAAANKAQVLAIGQGLARAATICAKASPPYAAMIQAKVAEMNSEALSLAFVAGLSEVQTASVSNGAGGASSGASGIGGNGAAGGGAGASGDDSIPTTSGSFDGNGQGSPFSSSSSRTTRLLTSPN
ncbi:hypothetical protein C8J36_102587 [Rhizobium sp. PP-F2F-G48]|nr:hypothetical protein C8J36_102587 [Rhizobium sp. PP-F2F-G48]